MVFTKELMAKGAAALGTAGVGGTGIYYAGDYLYGNSTHQGMPLINFMKEKKGNNIAFDVKKGGQKVVIGSNEVDFHSENSFEVSVVAASKSNSEPEEANTVPLDSSDPKLSCTFKFEVVGNYSNQTIKPDHKARP